MTPKPCISVIVPVYRCERYIEECVGSILNQSFTDFELILVDDGSPDSSGKICDELAEKHNKITVLHQENQGQAAARNNGVGIARGEWLCFVDCDDFVHPEMLEALYNSAAEGNAALSMCSAIQDEKLPSSFNAPINAEFRTVEADEDSILSLCKNEKYYYWVVWGKLIHRSIYEKHPLTEGRIYEDNAVVCKWLYEAKRVVLTDAPLYFYYVNHSGTTKNSFTKKHLDILWAFKEQIDFFNTINYKKMTEHLATYYLEISANMYYRAKTENARELLPIIRAEEKEIRRQYGEFIKPDTEQKLYYYERTNRPMFYVTRLMRKLGLSK